jgi:hypothetical protein
MATGIDASVRSRPAELRSEPAWLRGRRQFQPIAIAGSSYTNVFRSNQLEFSGYGADDWNGRASWVSLAAGGHAINNLNAVMRINLLDDSPRPVLLHHGSTPEVQDAAFQSRSPNNPHHYKDGLPASSHTYFEEFVIGQKDLAVRVEQFATHPDAQSWRNSDAFDLTKREWVLPVTKRFPERPAFTPGVTGITGPPTLCKDPRTEDIWWQNGDGVSRFDVGNWKWIPYAIPPTDMRWNYVGTCIDTKRNRRVIYGGGGTFAVHQIETNTYARVSVTADRVRGIPTGSEYANTIYDPDGDVYWYGVRTEPKVELAVWTIHPDSGQAQFRMMLPPAGAGPCSRFHYFRELRGIAYQPFNSDIYFIPLSD